MYVNTIKTTAKTIADLTIKSIFYFRIQTIY